MNQEDANNRKVVYLHRGRTDPRLARRISGAGWDLYPTEDPEQARALIGAGGIRIGLASLEQTDGRAQAETERLLSENHAVEWVGMLSSSCLENEWWRRLVVANCFDYHTLPVDPERVLFSLTQAYGMNHLRTVLDPYRTCIPSEYEMVGASAAMQGLFMDIRKVAGVDAPVLLTGESGTGKELTALAIHGQSRRARGPFVAVNCGALPPSLIQSELFGHEKGAFTGAHRRKIGRIESAVGGTIFLDEIGDLAPDLQANLLRFLQEQTIERVGGLESIHLDVRVITATHVDLEQAVEQGRFREDLYYRLAVLNIKLPCLRERIEDVLPLAHFFFSRFAKEKTRNVKGFSLEAQQAMRAYDWPGNVRELVNRVRRAIVMCDGHMITAQDLGLDRNARPRHTMSLDQARENADKSAIRHALQVAGNNVSRAAALLRVSRVTLYRLMEKYRMNLCSQS